jgi:restriction endonuclease Mrr
MSARERKSGNVGVKDIREFRDVLQKKKAAIGLFITLEESTRDMILKASKLTRIFRLDGNTSSLKSKF